MSIEILRFSKMFPPQEGRSRRTLCVLGIFSLHIYAAITWLSHAFVYGQGHLERPIGTFVCLYGAAFVLYTMAIRWLRHLDTRQSPLVLIFVFAVLFRALFLFSMPIQEDDYYRYLWDGKVVASGLNPYQFDPLNIQMGAANNAQLRPYRQIADEDEHFALLLSRVNNPGVPTIYPPVAQTVFALAALIAPGSLLALRLIFFCFELAVCAVLVSMLRHFNLSTSGVLIYAWSPLVIKESINSPHYDVVPTFLLVLALSAVLKGRTLLAHISLAGAILGKVFPGLLLPLFLHRTWQKDGFWAAAGGLVLTVVVVIAGYLPFWPGGSALWQGSLTFAGEWQTNSFVFPFLHMLTEDRWLANGIIVACLGGAVVIAVGRNSRGDEQQFLRGCFFVIGLLLLLSPVGNPWYFIWIVPFVCIFPCRSWLLLSGLLGLYYFAFYFFYRGELETFRWVVWLEYLPFYGLLMWEWWSKRYRR